MAQILVHLKPPEMTFHVHVSYQIPIEMVQFKVYEIMSIVAHISVTDPEAVLLVPWNLLSKRLSSYNYA